MSPFWNKDVSISHKPPKNDKWKWCTVRSSVVSHQMLFLLLLLSSTTQNNSICLIQKYMWNCNSNKSQYNCKAIKTGKCSEYQCTQIKAEKTNEIEQWIRVECRYGGEKERLVFNASSRVKKNRLILLHLLAFTEKESEEKRRNEKILVENDH